MQQPAVAVMPGCEAWSHAAGSPVGVLVLHGFTGTPASMRDIAKALAAAGHDVELPRLPGHGTSVDDMLSTTWHDWTAEVESAYQRLASRVERVVVVGLSMGGTLTLRMAFDHPSIAAIACVNPATKARPAKVLAAIDELIAEGTSVVPGEGRSDIADPDCFDTAYDGTPMVPLRSLLLDGIAPMSDRYVELMMPLRLFTSRNDHVVDPGDSVHLAASYGGPVEHTWLERSFHVATRDYDRELIIAELTTFVADLAPSSSAP
jgi:carboxylesterase